MADTTAPPPNNFGYSFGTDQQQPAQSATASPGTAGGTGGNNFGYSFGQQQQTTTPPPAPFVQPRDIARRTTQTPSTPMDVVRSFSDPIGMGATALQGAGLDLPGELWPRLKQRADVYGQAHPVASEVLHGGGMLGGQFAGGEVADAVAGLRAIAASPLARTLVRYALPTAEGAWVGHHATPADAPPGTDTANTILGGILGAGGQRAGDLAGNVVNRLMTNRIPAWTPTWPSIRNALGKAASGYATSWGMHHLMPDLSGFGEIGAIAQEALPHLIGAGESLREGIVGDVGTAAKDLYGNVASWLRTPTGPGRAMTGRFLPRVATPAPTRSALPGTILAPPLAGYGANSDLAKIMADWSD